MIDTLTMPEELVYWINERELAQYEGNTPVEDKVKDKLLEYYQTHDPDGINKKLMEMDKRFTNLPFFCSKSNALRMAYMLATRIMLVEEEHMVCLVDKLEEAVRSHIVNVLQKGFSILPNIDDAAYEAIFWKTYVLLFCCKKKTDKAEQITNELWAYLTNGDDTLNKKQYNECYGFDKVREYVEDLKTEVLTRKTYDYELRSRPFSPSDAPKPNYGNQHSQLFIWLSQLNLEQLESVFRLYPTSEAQEQLFDWLTCEEAAKFHSFVSDHSRGVLSTKLKSVLAQKADVIIANIRAEQYVAYECSAKEGSIFRQEVYEEEVVKAIRRLISGHDTMTGHWAIVWNFFHTYGFIRTDILQKDFLAWVRKAFDIEIKENTFKHRPAGVLKKINLRDACLTTKERKPKIAVRHICLDEVPQGHRDNYYSWIDRLYDTFVKADEKKLVPNSDYSAPFEIKSH